MANNSKDAPKSEAEELAIRQKRLKTMTFHMFANVVSLTMGVQAGPQLAASLLNDPAKVATFLAACSSATSGFEFVVNPTLGKWSDATGRRNLLMLGSLVNCILPLLLAALPKTIPTLFAVSVGCGITNAISGSTSTIASITDVCDGDMKMFAGAQASFGAFAGLGVIIGPAVGGAILAKTGNPSAVYAAKGIWSLLHFLWLRGNLEETLVEAKKKHFDGKFKSPLNFFELFTLSPMLRQVTVFNMLQCLGEGKCVNDLNQMWMKSALQWDVSSAARWTIGYGVMMVFNGAVFQKKALPALGPRMFVTMANIMGTVAMLTKGSIHKGWAYTLGLLFNTPAINAMGGVPIKAAGAIKAGEAGLGNADYAAKFGNLRALIYVFGPQLYLRIFARQMAAKSNPGLSYFVVALMAFVIPEIMHQQWTDDQILAKKP